MRERLTTKKDAGGRTIVKNAAAAIGAGLGVLLIFLFILVLWGDVMTAGGIVGMGLIAGAVAVPGVFTLLM